MLGVAAAALLVAVLASFLVSASDVHAQPATPQLAWSSLPSESVPGGQIQVADAFGAGMRRVDRDDFAVHRRPVWHPDGRRLAYEAGSHDGVGESGRLSDSVVFVVDVTGDAPAVRIAGGAEPAWSPDGSKLVYDALPSNLLTVRDLATGEDRVVDQGPFHFCPTFSPDGTMIATVSGVPEAPNGPAFPDYELHVVDLAGNRIANINTGDARECPAWSPDGTRLAYRLAGQPPRMVTSAVDGGNVVTVPGDRCLYDTRPAWSGSGLAFGRLYGRGDCQCTQPSDCVNSIQLYDGTSVRPLATLDDVYPGELHLRWSPDGSELAFDHIIAPPDCVDCTNCCRRNYEITFVRLDGSTRDLGGTPNDIEPAYGPPAPSATKPADTTSTTTTQAPTTTTVVRAATSSSLATPTTRAADSPLDSDEPTSSGSNSRTGPALVAAIADAVALAAAVRLRRQRRGASSNKSQPRPQSRSAGSRAPSPRDESR